MSAHKFFFCEGVGAFANDLRALASQCLRNSLQSFATNANWLCVFFCEVSATLNVNWAFVTEKERLQAGHHCKRKTRRIILCTEAGNFRRKQIGIDLQFSRISRFFLWELWRYKCFALDIYCKINILLRDTVPWEANKKNEGRKAGKLTLQLKEDIFTAEWAGLFLYLPKAKP